MRDFATRLVAYEARADRQSGATAFPVCAKLRPHLATLVGNAGYGALLSRALALSKAESPWLRTVQVESDGSLDAPEGLGGKVQPGKLREGQIILLAHLLGLLVAFIGDNLTMRLVGEIWPKVPLDDLDFGRGGK